MKRVAIIGSGFSSLSAACYLAKAGYKVSVYEKNDTIGGRARQLKLNGFTFDMGPTFYWMPDIFDQFFADFGKKTADYYELIRLDPGYEIYFGKNDSIPVSAKLDEVYKCFEKQEVGSSRFLRKFLKKAEYNYRVAIDKVVYKPGKSPLELIMPATAIRIFQFFSSISSVIRRNIKNEKLRQILEFPVIFLGAKPNQTPAFYCFMNYADMVLGTWHIRGGMYELVNGISKLALSLGVEIHTDCEVEKIVVEHQLAKGIVIKGILKETDMVISGADYHHAELLLDAPYRNYTEKYWQSKVFAPSALLFYVGFNKKIDKVSHHTLFFDTDFNLHAEKIYDTPDWPDKPLFYASFPSVTDSELAPEGMEAAIFLIPIAPGLKDTPAIRQHFFDQIIDRLETITEQSVKESILFQQSYSVSDFMKDYHAYKGNAYGLSNIITQTAFLKPKMHNKKVKNMFYTGQLTVPGPGVPPTIISGKIVAELATKKFVSDQKGGV
jgi:phytoene desaturase